MEITTTKFGTQTIDLSVHKRRGLNNIVESIIKQMKIDNSVRRLSAQEVADLHVEIRKQLIGL